MIRRRSPRSRTGVAPRSRPGRVSRPCRTGPPSSRGARGRGRRGKAAVLRGAARRRCQPRTKTAQPNWDRDPRSGVSRAVPDAASLIGQPRTCFPPPAVMVSRSRRRFPGRRILGADPESNSAGPARGTRARRCSSRARNSSSSMRSRTPVPSGPATVELWITQDGGRTWIRRGGDDDRVSPIEVDLGGEGTYGLCLVARSASGLGDQPPAPGDPPQSWVEVDSTAPVVQIQPPQIGTGVNAGKVAIAWRASDLHLPPRSVTLSWRPDQPGAQWQTIADGLDNAGQFIWNVPPAVSERFHLKVEATDSVGHHGSADTTESGPITVDRSRPRSRIIGLDPNAHSGIIAARRGRSPVTVTIRTLDLLQIAGPSSSLIASRSLDQLGGRGVEPLPRVRVDRHARHDRPVDAPLETKGKL